MLARKPLRLPSNPYYGRSSLYFLTICTHDRTPYFARPKLAAWVVDHIRAASRAKRFHLHAWCVMPDHVHVFVEGTSADCDLRAFVTRFKQQTGFQFARRYNRKLWQNYFYDHVVRPKESIDTIFWYIWLNPVRKGICADPRAYEFSGSDTVDWRRKTPITEPWTPPWKKPTPTTPAQAP